jgi:hypothetical protein
VFEALFGGIRGAGMARRSGRRAWVGLLAATVMLLAIPNVAAGQVAPTPDCHIEFFRVTGIFRDLVPGTRGRSDRFSIPRPGQANRLQRHFKVAYHLPAGGCVTITNVRVDLLNRDGVLLQTVTNSAPGGAGVSVVNDYTYRVRVTFGDGVTSSINSTPPPTDRIRYRITLTGRDNLGQEVTAVRDSNVYYPLWRMPDGLPRFGARSAGGDDWASQSTYNWLASNPALVTRINDISGEHARNIGHSTHYEGRNVDLYHLYTFPGVNAAAAGSGGANHAALIRNTNLALKGDTAARRLVADWVTQTRARFDQFIANADVQGRIIYALGSSQLETLDAQGQIVTPHLGRAWARVLLENGAYTNGRGQRVDLGIGAWTNPNIATRMLYADDHNDHIHISVRP